MKVSSTRKATGIVVTALAILTLAVGSAFAGTEGSRGYNKDSGNKYGNENKKATWSCPDDYWRTDPDYYDAWAYDLNGNDEICVGYANEQYNFIDDTFGQQAN